MRRIFFILALAMGLPLACQTAGGPAFSDSPAAAPSPLEDGAAADGGSRGGVLGTNPSPEEFQPGLDGIEKKKDDPKDGTNPDGAYKVSSAPLPDKSECGGTLLRLIAWKDDVRVASGQANKSDAEFFKFLQSGELDPNLVIEGSFRDLCVRDVSPETLASVPYPASGLHVLFKAADLAMTGLWTKSFASADQFNALLSGGQLLAVGMAEPPAADDAPAVAAPIRIPGKH